MPASAADNNVIGDIELINIDAADHTSVPANMYMSNRDVYGPIETTLIYNNSLQSFDFTREYGQAGELYIGGLYPAADHTFRFELGLDRTNVNSLFNIYTATGWYAVLRDSSDRYKIFSYYQNETGAKVSQSFSIPSESVINNKIILDIICDTESHTNKVVFNEGLQITTPFRTLECLYLPYPSLTHPTITCEPYVSGTDGYLTVHIYNVSMSIPQKPITVYPLNNITAFGLDVGYPAHNELGTAHMQNNGQVGTVWIDPYYDTVDANVNYRKSLLADGWELGIHFTPKLTSLSSSAAEAEMDAEMEAARTTYGQYPSSWCSLTNSDNVTHAVYMYNTYGAIWRNGRSGISMIPNVGNLENSSYTPFWINTTNAGAIYPCFTHHTDAAQAIKYSIDYANFCAYSDAYANKNIKIRGFYEYYKNGIVQTTNVSLLTNNENEFKYIVTNEFPANVRVTTNLNGWVIKERNGVYHNAFYTTGNESFVDGAGTYRIYTIPFSVTNSNPLNVSISTWTSTEKVWTLSSETQQSVTHTIGDLPANTDIQIKRDDINYETVTSNETGYIEWVYDGGFSEHTFEATVITVIDDKQISSNFAQYFNSIFNRFYRIIFQLPMRLI